MEEKLKDVFKLLVLIGVSAAATGVILLALAAVGNLGR